ncbi:MAG: J domain-containing protein [SAR202 cluster bacterium]|nr:J domain-containing protein [SAR202 cluster bacterium]
MATTTKDYYAVLGVSRQATEKDSRQAFRKLARKYHPDLNSKDRDAEARFKEINEAYEVLSDPEKRKKYDKYGDQWKHADRIKAQRQSGEPFTWTHTTTGDPSEGFGDFNLEDLLGGYGDLFRRRGRPGRAAPRPVSSELTVEVTLEEAFTGTTRVVTLTNDAGTKWIEVTIPAGVKTGSTVRVKPAEGQELLLKIVVTPHERLTRVDDDLYTDVSVPMEDAILGGEAEVQTLKSKVRLKVPPYSQNGQKVRLSGLGMPKLGEPGTKGDLYVIVRPVMPRSLSPEELDTVRRLKELRSKRG